MTLLRLSRRDALKLGGVAASLAPALVNAQTPEADADRERRMKWWHEAKFGMFIHWGLYSTLGRHEWAMEEEGIPVAEYEKQAWQFKPKPNAARDWAKLAKRAGMKYMVMTSKHHEGFCNFDTKTTNYNAAKTGPGRDLVKEYLDAARGEGLRAGLYFSLMDWHHPDGARCMSDEAARRRFVDYVHAQARELCTNYGKLDVLWYDVNWPLSAAGWESEKMNKMVRGLQPDIILNNRSGIPEDFDTPEQHIQASKSRNWEACMTMNDSWGFNKGDDNWKSPKTVIRNLVTCTRDGGNYLLNIGPMADGSIPPDSVRILSEVGQWMERNGAAVIGSDLCQVRSSEIATFTRKGKTLYAHVYYWPGEAVSIGGLQTKVQSVKYLATGQPVKFDQDDFRLRLTGLPADAPDHPLTSFAIECAGVPTQNNEKTRIERPRRGVGI
ncbi:MAG: alpha-L-fucosidase [Bryobacteraceae bacterium]|nr:alpha-L-fucosidase [Bryobacteraceae bacterium]